VICSFLRGLSVRDVEAALEETFDGQVVSKSTVSRICEDTRERYRRWSVGGWTATTWSTYSWTAST
jgi:putative transposase